MTPEVYSYLHHAFLCDVLRGHPAYADWLAGTFLRVYAHQRFERSNVPANFDVGDRLLVDPVTGRITQGVLDYYRAVPILDVRVLDRAGTEPADLLGEATADGRAVLAYVEKFHLPGTGEYGVRQSTHQVMVTGDGSSDGLRVHCMGARGQYVRNDVPLAAVVKAYEAAQVHAPHRRSVVLLRARPDGDVRFTTAVLHHELDLAVRGAGTTVPAGDSRLTYGPDASATVYEQAQRMIAGELPYDIRPLHVLFEARQRLVAALRLLDARGQAAGITDETRARAGQLVDMTAALRFLMLRCQTVGAGAGTADVWRPQAAQALDLEITLSHALRDETYES